MIKSTLLIWLIQIKKINSSKRNLRVSNIFLINTHDNVELIILILYILT